LPRVSEEDILQRQTAIAQEFHIYDEDMPTSRLFFMSDKVSHIWKTKAKAIEEGKIYVGG